jgi:hypothetical protein
VEKPNEEKMARVQRFAEHIGQEWRERFRLILECSESVDREHHYEAVRRFRLAQSIVDVALAEARCR